MLVAFSGAQYDAVMGLEIIEHVDHPKQFLKTLGSLTKSDGALFISTINRTPRAYALAILGAEYVAGIVPRGTHDWNKFVTPGEHLHVLFNNECVSILVSMFEAGRPERRWFGVRAAVYKRQSQISRKQDAEDQAKLSVIELREETVCVLMLLHSYCIRMKACFPDRRSHPSFWFLV